MTTSKGKARTSIGMRYGKLITDSRSFHNEKQFQGTVTSAVDESAV